MKKTKISLWALAVFCLFALATNAFAGEADIKIPPLDTVKFAGLGGISGSALMYIGILLCGIGALFGLVQYKQTKALPVHDSMAKVSHMIWETCKTYLFTQGKFLAILWVLIACCMVYYFGALQGNSAAHVVVILLASILGIMGSYGVAWFGIRINTVSNSRTAFSALKGNPLATLGIPLRSGMSVGLLLVCVELFFMICILMFLPRELVGPCFIGFAIGESLGASVLRICGGIFTKIADIGSDLMKIVFKLPEDDPKNPGVIADCTGDNAGDSVGPTADGFETYGVTGVALIAFLALALAASPTICATLIVWLFTMRALMIVTSLVSYFINEAISKAMFGGKKDFDFEAPLTHLVWITSAVSIVITFIASKLLLGDFMIANGVDPARESVVGALGHHQLRHGGGRVDSGIHQDLRQHQLEARQGSDQLLQTRRRVAEHPVGLCGRQFFGLLDGAVHHGAHGHLVFLFPKPGAALAHAGEIPLRRADLRVRPRGLRLPRHGTGDDCRGQLRPGHRQRPVGL